LRAGLQIDELGVRGKGIAAQERAEAEKTFKLAIEKYRQIAADAEEGS